MDDEEAEDDDDEEDGAPEYADENADKADAEDDGGEGLRNIVLNRSESTARRCEDDEEDAGTWKELEGDVFGKQSSTTASVR